MKVDGAVEVSVVNARLSIALAVRVAVGMVLEL